MGVTMNWKRRLRKWMMLKLDFFLARLGGSWIKFLRNPPAASHIDGALESQIPSCRRILNSMLRNHDTCLNSKLLQIIITDVKAIVKSRSLTFKTLTDPTSVIPLSPANLLMMKTKLIMPPP